MTIGISGRDVEGVEDMSFLYQFPRHHNSLRQFAEQFCDHVPPGLLIQVQVQCLHGLFRCLLSSEARPLVPPGPAGILSLLQVPEG